MTIRINSKFVDALAVAQTRKLIAAKGLTEGAHATGNDNPWGVTPAEAAAMDAILKHGTLKGAAHALGVALKTIEAHSTRVGKRMGQRTSLLKFLAWDRWRREGKTST